MGAGRMVLAQVIARKTKIAALSSERIEGALVAVGYCAGVASGSQVVDAVGKPAEVKETFGASLQRDTERTSRTSGARGSIGADAAS